MIIEWLSTVGSGIAAMIAGMFPAWAPPEWFVSFGFQIQDVLVPAVGLGVWVNFPVAVGVVAVVLSTWLICFGIKLFLRIGSHIPMFGGAG